MSAFCTACGASLKAEDRFCMRCGAAAPNTQATSNPAPSVEGSAPEGGARGSRARGPLGLAAAVIGVGLAAGAVYWGIREQTPSAPPPPPAATAPTANAADSAARRRTPPASLPPVAISQDSPAAQPPTVQQSAQVGLARSADTVVASSPAAPAKGLWMFSSGEDGVQLMFKRDHADEDGIIRFVCDVDDGVVWALDLAVLDDKVEALAARPGGLDMTISGEKDVATVARGYPASAPGETAIAWEMPRSTALIGSFTAPEFEIRAPGLSIKAADGGRQDSLTAFAKACPPVADHAADKLGWGTQTNRGFGYRLDVPKGLLRLVAGDRFVRRYLAEASDAELVVQNRVNATNQPLAKAIADETPALDKVVYQRRTKSFIVISGFSGERIVYYKARSTCGDANVVSFTLSYKTESRGSYDAIAERISKSFDRTTAADGTPLCP